MTEEDDTSGIQYFLLMCGVHDRVHAESCLCSSVCEFACFVCSSVHKSGLL